MSKLKAAEGKPSKSKMVAEAMDKLGHDAGPKSLMDYIKKTYNEDINYGMVASYKSTIKNRRAGGGGGSGRRGAGSGSVEMRDMIVVKELLERLGEPQLQSLIKVLRK